MKNKCYVFGAHSSARTLAVYLETLDQDITVSAFIVDNDEINPDSINGVPVIRLEEVVGSMKDNPVYLGIRGVYHDAVTKRLEAVGFDEIIPVTAELDADLRKSYFKKKYEDSGRRFVMIDDMAPIRKYEKESVRIYEVCSVYDKPLEKDHYIRKNYETPIQVGTSLTGNRINGCSIYDNAGDNISGLNRQLCEETALYWVWKNASEKTVGLVHYRRHFIFPEDWYDRMAGNDVDAILPIPLYVGPSVEDNYRFRHISSDWDCMMKVLKEFSEEESNFAKELFAGSFYFPLNIFVMKREVLNEYCNWLFPILFEVMKRIGERNDVYQNRYPAFMAERLLTLFFEMNRDKYKIVYADKGFLQ